MLKLHLGCGTIKIDGYINSDKGGYSECHPDQIVNLSNPLPYPDNSAEVMLMNPYDKVKEFEKTIADYAGSKYAVAVESGTAAIFLSCVYRKVGNVVIPKNTYPSVPMSIIHAGGKVSFTDIEWQGTYTLEPYGIVDSALRFKREMYND